MFEVSFGSGDIWEKKNHGDDFVSFSTTQVLINSPGQKIMVHLDEKGNFVVQSIYYKKGHKMDTLLTTYDHESDRNNDQKKGNAVYRGKIDEITIS